MAEFWSNNDRGYRIRLWIDQTSQNIGGNSSQVRVRLALLNGGYTFADYNCSAYVDLNGQRLNWTGRPSVLSNNSTLMLIDKTVTITHNADGKKSFALSARFSGSGGWSPGTLTIGSHAFTLTTIPRSSSVTVASGIIGSSVTININRQSSSFKHTVRYTWGSKSGTIASNVDTATTWTIPNDFANDIPNSTSGTGTIYVDTYSGSTKTGTQSVSFRADVPSSMKPTFSNVTLTDTNGAAGNLLTGNNFLQIISNVQVTFNGASGSYSSSIVGYKAEIVNRNQVTTSNGGTLGIMNFNGSATIRASVIDSRGRKSDTRDITINVIEYFSPILSFSAVRTRETPNIVQIVRNAKIAPITLSGSQKNVMTLTFKVASLGSTSYTADNGSATGTFTTQHTLTNSAANMAGNYPANKSFTVIGTLADKFTSIEFSATVATESVVMSYDKDGRVGVGKVVEQGKAGSLDVAGDIFAGGKLIQHHRLTNNNGTSRNIFVDPDTIVENGFYYLLSGPNRPFNSNGYLIVERYNADNKYIVQTFKNVYNGNQYIRVMTNGVWNPWVEQVRSDHPNLVNTGWVGIGNGFSYKRLGETVYLRYSFDTNGVQRFSPGTISAELIPGNMMFPITSWTFSPDRLIHIQVNADGRVEWINQSQWRFRYEGQISWAI
ncbi:DUF859 domain-containing protein [Streptococcus hyovaginalis]|uniref:DUF859 domain-containing protein n=1 Tax=Streptococcus hyovaginalis TaxID=149015 RepID=UPI000427B62D|nr:DUF859 domain-containing protein [Streptococcus hyovaginalis]QBX25414.1 capsid and scaffold protein [Streptococcus phage Javan258]